MPWCPRAVCCIPWISGLLSAWPALPPPLIPAPALLPGPVLAPQAQPQALLLREALPERAQPSDGPGPGACNLGGAGPPSDLLGQVSSWTSQAIFSTVFFLNKQNGYIQSFVRVLLCSSPGERAIERLPHASEVPSGKKGTWPPGAVFSHLLSPQRTAWTGSERRAQGPRSC